jgi:hypothetical protein
MVRGAHAFLATLLAIVVLLAVAVASGDSAVVKAVKAGDRAVVRALIESGADVSDMTNAEVEKIGHSTGRLSI